ncbi:MAG: hypothetical protein J6S60_05805 [Oscillospiraceae bacterium]|nr:hypothetical protein [Oscillospiraceae bacterium]
MKRDWKNWWDKAWKRALRTVAQALGSALTVGFIVTPQMIREMDIETVYIVLAWLSTGIIAGIYSLLMSLAGIPEENIPAEQEEEARP